MNFKRKLLLLLISFSFIIPINTYAYTKYLIPGGENIGIKVQAKGAYIVGFYSFPGDDEIKKADLKIGDRIVSINDIKINNVSDMLKNINSDDDTINVKFGFIRNNQLRYTSLNLKKDTSGSYKTGLYVKDSITGIGTLTYIDPSDNSYGALGHSVIEVNSGQNFIIDTGKIFSSQITGISKSKIGNPGEKNAKIDMNHVYGDIKYNLETGIFGTLKEKISHEDSIAVASIDEVKIGKAEIITVLNGEEKGKYEIEILSIDETNETKNFMIKVTDKDLLDKTGGIVKGMSGSPIIQNDKIVGAITHTLVDNPTKGYGISIIKMLEKKGN